MLPVGSFFLITQELRNCRGLISYS
jgi:hypothetical protein